MKDIICNFDINTLTGDSFEGYLITQNDLILLKGYLSHVFSLGYYDITVLLALIQNMTGVIRVNPSFLQD